MNSQGWAAQQALQAAGGQKQSCETPRTLPWLEGLHPGESPNLRFAGCCHSCSRASATALTCNDGMAKAAAQLWLQLCFLVLGSGWPACPPAPPEKLSSAGRVPQDPGGEGPVSSAAKLPWSASPSGYQAHNSAAWDQLGKHQVLIYGGKHKIKCLVQKVWQLLLEDAGVDSLQWQSAGSEPLQSSLLFAESFTDSPGFLQILVPEGCAGSATCSRAISAPLCLQMS